MRGLQTSDLRRAEQLASALDDQVSRLFEVAARVVKRIGGSMVESDNPADVLRGQELIERLCDTYLRQLLAEDRASRQSGEESGDVDGGLLYVADAYAADVYHERVEVVEEAAQALLAAEGVDLSGAPLQQFLTRLLQTRVVALKAALTERAEDGRYDPRSIQLSRTSPATPDTADQHTVGELAALFVQHQRDSGTWKSGDTAKQRAARIQRLVEWFGADTPLSEIDPLRCQGVFELFQQRSLAPTTQNTELKTLNSLFNYAVKVEWMTRNPAKGLRAKEPPPRDQKFPLDSDDLRKVFSPALFEATKGRKPIGRKRGERTAEVFMGERLWGPLLILYAGLRPGEVDQAPTRRLRDRRRGAVPHGGARGRWHVEDGSEQAAHSRAFAPRRTRSHGVRGRASCCGGTASISPLYPAQGTREGAHRVVPGLPQVGRPRRQAQDPAQPTAHIQSARGRRRRTGLDDHRSNGAPRSHDDTRAVRQRNERGSPARCRGAT